MLLLGPTMQSQLLHLSGGRELWDELEEQFGLWEDCQGPVWQLEWRQIGPLPLERVVAYSRRAEALAVKLGRAGRPVPEASLVDDVLDGLIRERPEWQGYLSGIKGALPSTQGGGLKALRPHLGDLERTGTDTCHLPGTLCWLLPLWRMRQPRRRQLRRASPVWGEL
jgi:hypothetical protein